MKDHLETSIFGEEEEPPAGSMEPATVRPRTRREAREAELAALRQLRGRGRSAKGKPSVLRRLAYGLYAIVRLHLAKEEDVYLPLLDARMTAGQASSLFAAMARAAAEARRVG